MNTCIVLIRQSNQEDSAADLPLINGGIFSTCNGHFVDKWHHKNSQSCSGRSSTTADNTRRVLSSCLPRRQQHSLSQMVDLSVDLSVDIKMNVTCEVM